MSNSRATLPGDNHVHTEFSYDAGDGSMLASCQRAVELGLPSIAFTEHIDMTPWFVPEPTRPAFVGLGVSIDEAGCAHAPEFDLDGYFESIEMCRSRFPDLRIFSGVEIGEPHWFPEETKRLLSRGHFERVLGSVHTVDLPNEYRLVDEWFRTEAVVDQAEDDAVRAYLATAIDMIEKNDDFEVFAHIDYLTRQIVAAGRTHDPGRFEDEYRQTLRALVEADRVLEINTRVPLDAKIVGWWYDVGGQAVSFGSDAHSGPKVGHGFVEASAMAEACGFCRQEDPLQFWCRA